MPSSSWRLSPRHPVHLGDPARAKAMAAVVAVAQAVAQAAVVAQAAATAQVIAVDVVVVTAEVAAAAAAKDRAVGVGLAVGEVVAPVMAHQVVASFVYPLLAQVVHRSWLALVMQARSLGPAQPPP